MKLGAIVPGKPGESEMLTRVSSDDSDVRMPPPVSKLGHLSKEEITKLRQWIAEGAEYQPHWSFVPLRPVALPTVKLPNGGGKTSPIDAIVCDSLARRGLKMQPEADRATLIRRVAFDLTGLPPTPEEVEAFVADTSPNAYERVVDRLLASQQYGERMAVDWLDIARYADSYGFQVDAGRGLGMARLGRRVVQSQSAVRSVRHLAACGRPAAPRDRRTDPRHGVQPLHQQETEGGSVEEEYRVEYVCDRVQTFSTAFLGLTIQCCRCHDHKFDPITQKEYYQFLRCSRTLMRPVCIRFSPTPRRRRRCLV